MTPRPHADQVSAPPTHDARREHLQALARDINATGRLTAGLIDPEPGEPLVLRVVNPAHEDVAEDIGADLLAAVWWYVWGWGDRLRPVGDRAGAVAAISHVLGLRPRS